MRSPKNRIVAGAAGFAAVGILLAGCSTSSSSPGSSTSTSTKTLTIGFVNGGTTEFHTCLQKGVQAASTKDGVKLLVENSQQDPTKELANVEDMISRRVDAIIVQTVNVDALNNGVAKAKAAGIPFFVTNVLPGNANDILGAVTTDIVSEGHLDAGWVAKDAGGASVDAAIIAGAPGAGSDLMASGFQKGIPANVHLVANQPAMFQRAMAQNVAQNIVQAHPNLKYAFVAGEDMAFGASQAFKAAGKNVKIVTLNGSPEGIAAVKDGTFAATVSTPAYPVGYDALNNTVALLHGSKTVKKFSSVPVKLITKSNTASAPAYCS